MTVVKADIEAALDVITDLCEQADQISGVEEVMDVLEQLGLLAAAVRRAQSMVEAQAVSLLEQPVVISGRRYVKANEYKRRFEHERIAKLVADQALVYSTTGEIRSARDAVAKAVALMQAIYVSPSTDAKVGALRHYLGVGGVVEENLARDEWTGAKVHVYPVESTEKE